MEGGKENISRVLKSRAAIAVQMIGQFQSLSVKIVSSRLSPNFVRAVKIWFTF